MKYTMKQYNRSIILITGKAPVKRLPFFLVACLFHEIKYATLNKNNVFNTGKTNTAKIEITNGLWFSLLLYSS